MNSSNLSFPFCVRIPHEDFGGVTSVSGVERLPIGLSAGGLAKLETPKTVGLCGNA
ncbi:Uncharacterised protein [Mycobacteroides abscessus subsp. abscessus]|nr:Uncharacterised protein [Mycobacteroides abscessus subsp. abscessus]